MRSYATHLPPDSFLWSYFQSMQILWHLQYLYYILRVIGLSNFAILSVGFASWLVFNCMPRFHWDNSAKSSAKYTSRSSNLSHIGILQPNWFKFASFLCFSNAQDNAEYIEKGNRHPCFTPVYHVNSSDRFFQKITQALTSKSVCNTFMIEISLSGIPRLHVSRTLFKVPHYDIKTF